MCTLLLPSSPLQVQQFFLLSQTDRMWKEHLQAMKFLQTAIGLRGYAQRVCWSGVYNAELPNRNNYP